MTREEAFEIWAPNASTWHPWAKAVLFSFMSAPVSGDPPAAAVGWAVPLLEDTAIVVDLPGARGVATGISLACAGYRPVPLYNACPPDPGSLAVVDVDPVLRTLARESSTLQAIVLHPAAPPAFLLDANRHGAGISPRAGWFDNRSIVRETDLPSAAFLTGRGIRRVVVIASGAKAQSDLQQILLAWQEAGMTLFRQVPDERWAPVAWTVPRPSPLRAWWGRLLQRFGYPLNDAGSFGRSIHGSTHGSGG